jgi:hypothetical protein
MDEGPVKILLKRGTNGQQVYEKMLNSINYQGNANQSHNEMSSTPETKATMSSHQTK